VHVDVSWAKIVNITNLIMMVELAVVLQQNHNELRCVAEFAHKKKLRGRRSFLDMWSRGD
jgi:hypothetical protein